MHKGIILLVKPDENEQDVVISQIREFMEGYEGSVWDWYQIGGRWTNKLAPKNKEFLEWVESFLLSKEPERDGKKVDWISQNTVVKHQKELQDKWIELGMEGQNSYCDHYQLGDDGNVYDVIPLSKCLETVKDYSYDYIEQGKKELVEAEYWLTGKKGKNDYNMYGYCLTKAGKIFNQNFCFDCNVYNITEDDYSIPENVDGWWAVMVDMHS